MTSAQENFVYDMIINTILNYDFDSKEFKGVIEYMYSDEYTNDISDLTQKRITMAIADIVNTNEDSVKRTILTTIIRVTNVNA
jgi:hypothetical protein